LPGIAPPRNPLARADENSALRSPTLRSPSARPFSKQLNFLERDLHHPSLHAKKYDETRDFWQARVNRDWRFYFKIVADVYVILDVVPHPK
jgi:plasmid maintenance system killer protein